MKQHHHIATFIQLTDLSSEGILVLSTDMETIYVNKSLQSLIGRKESVDAYQLFPKQLLEELELFMHHSSIPNWTCWTSLDFTSSEQIFKVRFERLKDDHEHIAIFISDVSEWYRLQRQQEHFSLNYDSLFEDSPIPIWEEDFSEVFAALNQLNKQNIDNLEVYFRNHPMELYRIADFMKVIRINEAVVRINEADSKDQVLRYYKGLATENSFDYILKQFLAIFHGEASCEFDAELKTFKGNTRYVHFKWNVVRGHESDYSKVHLTTTDLTERIKEENLILQQSNREKETLLKEIHHRVKNNLQIVASLLRLQANNSDLPELHEMLNVSLGRIHSMAAVHELLYRSNSLTKIDYDTYLESMVNGLMQTFNSTGKVELDLKLIPIQLDIDTAIPLGLFLNEVLTNAFKHAFKKSSDPKIYLHMEYTQMGGCMLRIGDNGTGFNPMDEPVKESLGMTLIHNLVNQFNGELQIDSSNMGTCYTLKIH